MQQELRKLRQFTTLAAGRGCDYEQTVAEYEICQEGFPVAKALVHQSDLVGFPFWAEIYDLTGGMDWMFSFDGETFPTVEEAETAIRFHLESYPIFTG